MYIFITSLVSIFFFILLKNIKLSLYMMYIVHLYVGFYTQLFLELFFADLNYWVQISRDFTFFLGFSFPRIYLLFSWDFIGSTQKKFQESKTQDFISSDIFSKDLRKFWHFSKVFISRFFFKKLFSRDFLT